MRTSRPWRSSWRQPWNSGNRAVYPACCLESPQTFRSGICLINMCVFNPNGIIRVINSPQIPMNFHKNSISSSQHSAQNWYLEAQLLPLVFFGHGVQGNVDRWWISPWQCGSMTKNAKTPGEMMGRWRAMPIFLGTTPGKMMGKMAIKHQLSQMYIYICKYVYVYIYIYMFSDKAN